MDKSEVLFWIGWLLCCFMGGATFPQKTEEINPWLFRVGVLMVMQAILLKYF